MTTGALARVDRFAELRSVGSRAVAERFGLRRSPRGRFACPCEPDAEPALAIVGTTGWRCHRCGAHGDAAGLAGWITTSTVKPAEWTAVLAACASLGLCAAADGDPAPTLPPPPPARPAPPRTPPPAAEVAELWNLAGPAEDTGLRGWLARAGRRIDAGRCSGLDLARVLARGARDLPGWARLGRRSWAETGHRLIVPLFDADGRMRSLAARRIGDAEDGLPRVALPRGHAASGLVMADEVGRALLAGDELSGWPGMSAAEHARARGVVIVEGLTDYLAAASAASDGPPPAVVGIQSGAWTTAHAARIPRGAAVAIAADADAAGDTYAREVHATLGHACCLRVTPARVPALLAELGSATAAGQ